MNNEQRALDAIAGIEIGKTQRMIEVRDIHFFRAAGSSRMAAWDDRDGDDQTQPSPRVDEAFAIISVAEFDKYHPPQWSEEQDDWNQFKRVVDAARSDGIDIIVLTW